MKLIAATINDVNTVFDISQSVIGEEYPKYYPSGALEMFSSLHSRENIRKNIENEMVYLITVSEKAVGTVTAEKNHICRFFILSDFQRQGIGNAVMDEVEAIILRKYDKIVLDASLPAQSLYLKRGYSPIEYIKYKCDNGDFLCYNIMCKSK